MSAKTEEHELLVRQVLECCSHSDDRIGEWLTGWLWPTVRITSLYLVAAVDFLEWPLWDL